MRREPNAKTRLSVVEAGRVGGLTTLTRYGVAHYKTAGKKGQARTAAKYSSADRRLWGQRGGRPRKVPYQGLGEKGSFDDRRKGARPASSPSPPEIITLQAERKVTHQISTEGMVNT